MDNATSYDAENAVLSLLVNYPEQFSLETINLKSDMFSSIAHRQLFEHIQRVINNGGIPDKSLIEIQIRENPQLAKDFDFSFFQYISSLSYDKANFYEFTRIVEQSYKKKEMYNLATGLPTVLKTTDDVDSVIDDVKVTLDRIGDVSGGEGTSSINTLIPEAKRTMEYRLSHPNEVAWPTGFETLDFFTNGYKPGNVMIVAARPSVGKTAWMCNSLLRSAEKGVRVLAFEHEMEKQDLVDRLLATYCGIKLINIRNGKLTNDEVNTLMSALDHIGTLPIYLDTTFGTGINYIKPTTRRYVKLHGINVVYLDYIQLIVERTSNMTMDLGNVSRDLKVMATSLGVQVVALSQLNRGLESREDHRPTLSDLRQSGNLEEDADLVIMLYREDMYKDSAKVKNIVPIEFLIRKHRNGPTGMMPMMMRLDDNYIAENIK